MYNTKNNQTTKKGLMPNIKICLRKILPSKLRARFVRIPQEIMKQLSTKITVIVVEPNKAPVVQQISDTITEIERLVGGVAKENCPFRDCVWIYSNASREAAGTVPNRFIVGKSIPCGEMIYGTFVICGQDHDNYLQPTSLTNEQIQRYMQMFQLETTGERLNGSPPECKYSKDKAREK